MALASLEAARAGKLTDTLARSRPGFELEPLGNAGVADRPGRKPRDEILHSIRNRRHSPGPALAAGAAIASDRVSPAGTSAQQTDGRKTGSATTPCEPICVALRSAGDPHLRPFRTADPSMARDLS
jgi:hypothetical protein